MPSDSEGMLRIINASTGEVENTIRAHDGSISCLVTSYDRAFFATASKDAKAKVFDMLTQEEICCFATDRPLNGAVADSEPAGGGRWCGGARCDDDAHAEDGGEWSVGSVIVELVLRPCLQGGDWSREGLLRYHELCAVQSRWQEVGASESVDV